MKRLAGRVAVVTGGASGLGLAMARRFAEESMQVVIADVEEVALAEAEKTLSANGADVLACRTDVSRWEDVQALADATMERFGAVHVVCNNAGVVTAGPVHELTFDDWQWVLGVNLWGAIHGVKAFLPLLLEQEEAHILGTSSTAGLIASPGIAPYNVSKFGVVALMESVARDLGKAGRHVGVSVVCPSNVATGITDSARNRPDALGDHADTNVGRRFEASAGEAVAAGMAPSEVALQVIAAIRRRQFWILTHPEWKDLLRKRIDCLIADDGLPERYP